MTRTFTPEFIADITRDGVATFRQHENGIIEYTLLKTGRVSLECFFTLVHHLAKDEVPTNPPFRILLDMSRVVPSITQATIKSREFFRMYPDRPLVRQIIFVGGGKMQKDFMETFVWSLRLKGYKTRFMAAAQRDEAIQWLLADD